MPRTGIRPDQTAGSAWGILVVHGRGTAGQDDGARPSALELVVGRIVGQQFGVDVELAYAASDQLRELAAEVEDRDRSRGGRDLGRGAIRGRRVERGLEIRLDLRVIGGKDTMPGIRRLAVDGLAALAFAPLG